MERLKKYEGLDMDKQRTPGNPNFTVRDTIKLADEVAELTRQRDVLLVAVSALADAAGQWTCHSEALRITHFQARVAINSVKGGAK